MKSIHHKKYGEGIIIKSRYQGLQHLVKFNDDIYRWVFDTDLKKIEEEQKPTQKKEILKLKSPVNHSNFNSRWKIETLRLGIFPEEFIEEFTFGRAKERRSLLNWINNSKNGSIIISGEYGVGKTHFLEYFKKETIKENWAVSFLQFDSNQNPLNKPKALYSEIIKGFEFLRGNFRDFIKEAAHSCNNPESLAILKEHKHIYEVIKRINTNRESDAWEWIKGKFHQARLDSRSPPIYTYSTTPNIYCYILSGIGYIAKHILGLNGFLILFDEAEYIDPLWYNTYQRTKGWNFLRGLIMMSNNSEILLNESIDKIAVSNKVSEELWGNESDLQYTDKFPCRYLWKNPSSVKLILAFTPDERLFSVNPLNKLERFELENLNNKIKQKIATEISNIYLKAYRFKTKKAVPLDFIENIESTRLYLKSIVEILDLIRFHPNKSVEELLA